MKLLTIAVTDEEHTHIKTEAAKRAITIKSYLLGDKLLSIADDKTIVRKVSNPLTGNKKPTVEMKAGKYCPDSHSIPPDRSRCMGKGCKYS